LSLLNPAPGRAGLHRQEDRGRAVRVRPDGAEPPHQRPGGGRAQPARRAGALGHRTPAL